MVFIFFKPTRNKVNIVCPWTTFAIPTFIGSSILPVCQVSSRACSTPSLMLNSKSSVASLGSLQSTFCYGITSSSIETTHKKAFSIHLWNGSATCISVTASGSNCNTRSIKINSHLEKENKKRDRSQPC